MTTTEVKTATPQKTVRDWIKEYSEDRATVTVEELRAAARVRFGGDDDFTRALAEIALDQLVNEQMRVAFYGNRRIALGAEMVTREEFDRRAEGGTRWERWLAQREHCGRGFVRLPDMTKADLLEAIQARREQVHGQMLTLAFLEAIAKKVPDDKRVIDCFTAEQLDALHARAVKAQQKENA